MVSSGIKSPGPPALPGCRLRDLSSPRPPVADRDHPPAASLDLLYVTHHAVVGGVRGVSTTTGMRSSMSAMGPCFISPAA